MYVFGSVLIGPLHMANKSHSSPTSEEQLPLHSCYVIANITKLTCSTLHVKCCVIYDTEVFITSILVRLPLPQCHIIYITPVVCMVCILHCLQWSKTIRALDSYKKVKESVQRCYFWSRVRKDCQSMNSTLTDFLIECFEPYAYIPS